MPLIRPSLRAYNLAQLAVIEHPAEGDVPAHTSLLSESTVAVGTEEERFVDYGSKRSFAFDHVTVAVTDYQPYNLPEEEEAFRAELAASLAKYTKNHFPSGISSVSSSQFPLLPPAPPKPEPTPAAAAETEAPPPAQDEGEKPETDVEPTDMESAVEDAKKEGVEDIPTGDVEPESTPAEGEDAGAPEKADETVAEPGGVEKLDEELKEEVKEEGEPKEPKEEEPETKADDTEDGAEKATASEDAVESKEAAATTEPANEDEAGQEESAEVGEEQTAKDEPPVEEEVAPEPERVQERVENPTYTLEVVGNRYKPSNFWTGRWRTRWTVDQAKGSVDGTILVDVHYYEQGNLTTNHTASFPCPTEANGSQSVASQIVTTISKIEAAYHMELNDVYEELGEKAFRALRRALPVTRQKMDWEKVSGYSLGADLSKARS